MSSDTRIIEPKSPGDSAAGSRAQWSGKLAFVLAAAASAVGLGSMWRFPYLAAHYGGGAFLLLFVVFVFTLGISLLTLEVAFGRKTRQSAIGAYRQFGDRYSFIGVLSSAVPFIIAPYYCVIGGWVTKYAFAYVFDSPSAMADGGTYFSSFIANGPQSVSFMLVFLAVTFLTVALGVNGGIEKANLIMMPALIVMSIAVAAYTLTLPGALDGLVYYLKPDFSKFSIDLVVAALGQTFFALSIAMAIMVTYGSYVKSEVSIPTSSVQTAGMTLGISLLAGMMVVPAAFVAFGSGVAVAENSGPSLMFIVLPQVFENMGSVAGALGFVFFLLVFFAALTSAISLVEACTSILADALGAMRRRALVIVIVYVSVVGIVVALGYSGLSFIQPMGEGSTILDALDFVSNSVLMPAVALITCLFFGWIVKPRVIIDEIRRSSEFSLANAWSAMIKYVAPVCILVILVASIGKSLGFFSF